MSDGDKPEILVLGRIYAPTLDALSKATRFVAYGPPPIRTLCCEKPATPFAPR